MTKGFLITWPILLGLSFTTRLQAQETSIPDPTQVPDTQSWEARLAPKDSARLVVFIRKGCQDSTSFVGPVQHQKGFVKYSQRLASYVIESGGAPDTFDSYFTCIPCNWPQVAQWHNQRVIFSGRRYHAPGILKETGGETTLYLYITDIKSAN